MKQLRGPSFLLLLLFLMLLTSCGDDGFTVEKSGVAEFDIYDGELEINLHMLPPGDFLSRFPTIAANYHYLARYKHKLSFGAVETSIVTAQYLPEVYKEAKAYCLTQMVLKDIEVKDYNGYHFIENIELAIGQGRRDGDHVNSFPWDFNLLAFNDERKEIAFLGFSSPTLTYKDRKTVVENWADFIEEYFPEIT